MIQLSIIVPIYNAERYIEECLESIVHELTEEMELLLIDDGSTDFSLERIARYERQNIHIVHHENRGVSFSRNRGIREARGQYLMFVDADDRMMPRWANSVLQACKSRNDVVYFSKCLQGKQENKEAIIDTIFGIDIAEKLGNMSSPVSRVFRREFLMNNNFLFHEELINGEDALFNLGVILSAKRFMYIEESIYQYRHYDASATRRYNEKFFESNLLFLKLSEKIVSNSELSLKVNRYVGRSFVYSIYLYLFLISRISDMPKRKESLSKLSDKRMKVYFDEYKTSADCPIQVRCIYWLVRNKMYTIALLAMKTINMLRSQNKGESIWETI